MTGTVQKLVVVGTSAGGIAALKAIFAGLPAKQPGFSVKAAMAIVLHMRNGGSLDVSRIFPEAAGIIHEAIDKTILQPGHIYLAPPGYHLLVETDRTLALSNDEPVIYSRPSIDVLFETAAEAFGADTIGIVLTGASHDGAAGLSAIASKGGICAVQEPQEAEASAMPKAALAAVSGAASLPLKAVGAWIQAAIGKTPTTLQSAGESL